jgi:hypothetical protein
MHSCQNQNLTATGMISKIEMKMTRVNEHQMPDHLRTFIKMIKGRANEMPIANDERCQVSNLCVTWDESIDGFEIFGNNAECHYGQIGTGYLFDKEF